MRKRDLFKVAGIVHEELSGEIIGSVDNKIIVIDNVKRIGRRQEFLISSSRYVGIYGFEFFGRRLDFGVSQIRCSMGNLPLEVLQGGSPADVRKTVRETVEQGKRVGRFIFGSSHSIAVGTPYENFMAMAEEFEKVRDY